MRKSNRPTQHAREPQLTNDPEAMSQPISALDYQRRGYAYYTIGKYNEAEADFRKAIEMDAKDVDSVYALGMTLKAAKRTQDSVKAFKQAISLIDSGVIQNQNRRDMLRRMAIGHVNEITKGDWDLEKEIWEHID
jgi:tetratricopeptide (TPR) repeat protein